MAFFFTSPIGLGHITRDIAILEKLANLSSNVSMNLITGLKAYEFLSIYPKKQFDKINLQYYDLYKPPKFFISNGILKNNLVWLFLYLSYYRSSKKLAKNLLNSPRFETKDKLIISDEDFASISAAKDLKRPKLLITDILHTNFVKSRVFSGVERLLNGSMYRLVQSCNSVIVPELGNNKDNIIYVGPIVREILTSRDELRRRFSFHRKTILITTGGTHAGSYLIKNVLRILTTLNNKFDFDLILSYPYDLRVTGIEGFSFNNIGFVHNIHEYIYAADLVISLAGKSTIDECNMYGTPGIFIPIRDHFEQEERAMKCGFSYDDIYRLEGIIEEYLSNIGVRKKSQVKNGATQAARMISEYLNE
jgi:UDP-N-acetylglucosamine--N-acetylmuramyl-(pentapeptide) pyrophosphoryl-undecaprenol N-acetylglucosamine transferase